MPTFKILLFSTFTEPPAVKVLTEASVLSKFVSPLKVPSPMATLHPSKLASSSKEMPPPAPPLIVELTASNEP